MRKFAAKLMREIHMAIIFIAKIYYNFKVSTVYKNEADIQINYSFFLYFICFT